MQQQRSTGIPKNAEIRRPSIFFGGFLFWLCADDHHRNIADLYDDLVCQHKF
jgi:hypothetical protein